MLQAFNKSHTVPTRFHAISIIHAPFIIPRYPITSIKSEIKYSPKMILVKLQLVLRISDIKITKMVSEWGEARPSEHVYSTVGDFTYRIYLIKCPGVYFLAASVEGAFKRDGRLFETGVYCFVYFKLLLISSYYALFGCCHSSQLQS